MLLKNFKDLLNSLILKKEEKILDQYFDNCNSIACSISHIKEIIKDNKKQQDLLFNIANSIIEKQNAK